MILIEYNTIKDLLMFYDPVFGYISLDFILNSVQDFLNDQKHFEDVIYDILKNINYDNRTIASLFNLSSTDNIKFYIDMIQENL